MTAAYDVNSTALQPLLNGTGVSTTRPSVNTHSPFHVAMDNYLEIHGPLALFVCVVGVAMNILTIIVLAHKEMKSPVNRLLQAIAVANLITMLTYIPYSLLFYILHGVNPNSQRNTWHNASYLMFHAMCSIISHTTSIWLTVSVAIFRYLYLSAKNGRVLCSLFRANLTIGIVTMASALLNLPQLLVLKINFYHDRHTNTTWYHVMTNGMGEHNRLINLIQYTIMAVLVKIGPSLLLIILSGLLIRFILKAQRKYQRMRSIHGGSLHLGPNEKKRQEQTNKTTQLLIVVAIVFTMSELPQGILFALNSLGREYRSVYYLLGNLMDLLTIVSCSINFVLYCAMSQQFRKIFVKICKVKILRSLTVFFHRKSYESSPPTSLPTEQTPTAEAHKLEECSDSGLFSNSAEKMQDEEGEKDHRRKTNVV